MLEQQILSTAQQAIEKSIIESLTGYNSPLQKLCERVIEEHSGSLFQLIDKEFSTLLDGETFKEELGKALNKKLASVLVGRMGGELEKQVNQLKANPETRARIMLAISEIVEESRS